MSESNMIGTRIREHRIMKGIKQGDLAQKSGISASYLNLIEHNKRKIGGRVLLNLANVLGVEPSLLSEGAEASLIAALAKVSGALPLGASVEMDRLDEFAVRFPGLAQYLVELIRQRDELDCAVKMFSERLVHDPLLIKTLHEVISTVTSIRSAASILAENRELESVWQSRFQRNIDEDSRRLAESAEMLVKHLQTAPDAGSALMTPQEELYGFLEDNGYHFPEFEVLNLDFDHAVKNISWHGSDAGHSLVVRYLRQYSRDAMAIPDATLRQVITRSGPSPEMLATATGSPLPTVFRRLATLPKELCEPVGLVVCDGAGAVLMRKEIGGFKIPIDVAGCPLWPIYQSLSQPGVPIRETLVQGQAVVETFSVTETVRQAGFSVPALLNAHMLILPGSEKKQARQVGRTCKICPVENCEARREKSMLASDF
ncbi:MAG: helix-turn-helix domain-containing protein [Roseovarius sp.]|nr:helix-turn-helix domain-containing protein [Roseovarius sp.]MCY4207348.1 helix-turn-helix domain-containing protein [Roseovarius sp.]MCY4291665.1 helix-turn-helix domain-containing protein [Roseovarius sp.]